MTGEMSAGTYIDPGMDGPVPCIHVATLCQELESLSDPKLDSGLLDFN